MTEEDKAKRDWLNRAFYAEKKLDALLHKRKRDRERAQRITAVFGGNIKGKSDSRENSVQESLMRLLGSDEEYNKYFEEYLLLRKEIEDTICGLHDPEIEAVLIYRYLDYVPSLEKIAEKMHYSYETVKDRHKKGLRLLKIHP